MGSIWDGLEKAETFERGNYVKGNFNGVVEIVRTLVKETRSSGVAFIVEMKVIRTNMEEDHPIGQKVTWFQKLTDTDIAFPAVAEWAAACAGISPSDKSKVKKEVMPSIKEAMEYATDNPTDNDFVGMHVSLETLQKKTLKDRDFTQYIWGPTTQPQSS